MKHIRMVLYGEPGVGKSTFAVHAPRPFFITTDANYEYLEEFGAKEQDHVQVSSWAEAKKAFSRNFDGYDTVVVDLLEDLFKWCEYEFCKTNGYDHISEPGYAKGYDITRNDFFINICKVLNLQKNVILIMHGTTVTYKDRRGIEHQKYAPSSRLPEKVVDMIEGRVRAFLRCYLKDEEDENGNLIKKRYLSLVPKSNEFGIIRGMNENIIPVDIPLDWNTFASIINLENGTSISEKEESSEMPTELKAKVVDIKAKTFKPVETKTETVKPTIVEASKPDTPDKPANNNVEFSKPDKPVEEVETPVEKKVMTAAEKLAALKAQISKKVMIKAEPVTVENIEPTKTEEVKEEVKVETKVEDKPVEKKEQTKEEKLAAIRAKMLELQKNRK